MSVTGKVKFFNETKGFLSVASCNSGPAAPANGPAAAAFPGECWANTTTSLWQFFYTPDGTNWVKFGSLDIVALTWTPYFGGSPIAASSPVTYSVNAGLVTISCPTCLTAQNIPLGQKVGGLGISPGGLLYAGPLGSRSMPTPFGIGQVPLSNAKGAPSWSQWTMPSGVQAGSIFYATLNNVFSAIPLPSCANDGGHALVFVNNALVCEAFGTDTIIAGSGLSSSGTCSSVNISCTLALALIPTSNVLGNFSGGSAAPSAQSVPSCANDGSHALVNPSAGGFACETISNSASTNAGFLNALRNSSMTAWFHGSGTLTITTAGGWCAEGIYVKPTGASVTCQQTTTCPTGNPTYYCLKITSATSVTAIQVRFVVESFTAAKLAGLQTTFQFLALNNCGASVTPTIQALYPTAQDNYTATGTDLSSANMQAIANGASQTEAYSWQASANVDNGNSIDIGLGACGASASDSFTIGGGFDWRATTGATTGTIASPPTPEIQDPASDTNWSRRFYETSYDNGTAFGTATNTGMVDIGAEGVAAVGMGVPFKIPKRASPTMTYFDGAGTSNKSSSYTAGAWNNGTQTVTAVSASTTNSVVTLGATTTAHQWVHFAADATLTGAWLLGHDLDPANDNAPAFLAEVA